MLEAHRHNCAPFWTEQKIGSLGATHLSGCSKSQKAGMGSMPENIRESNIEIDVKEDFAIYILFAKRTRALVPWTLEDVPHEIVQRHKPRIANFAIQDPACREQNVGKTTKTGWRLSFVVELQWKEICAAPSRGRRQRGGLWKSLFHRNSNTQDNLHRVCGRFAYILFLTVWVSTISRQQQCLGGVWVV